jgi:hypothetical protein
MAAGEIHVGDIGTVFTITIKDGSSAVDVSTATTKEILVTKPDGTEVTWAASFVTSGADGKIKYTTASAGDLNQVGAYRIQAHIVFLTGDWHTDIGDFYVHGNL